MEIDKFMYEFKENISNDRRKFENHKEKCFRCRHSFFLGECTEGKILHNNIKYYLEKFPFYVALQLSMFLKEVEKKHEKKD